MRSRGFTLLEVMVAVAILGLGLTAILSAQAGAFSSATHARNISVATGLARCKMTEIEQKIAQVGLPAVDENDSGPCCEGDESPMQCAWRIERPELPEPKYGDLNLDSDLGDIGSLASGAASASPGGAPSPDKLGDLAQSLAGSPGAAADGAAAAGAGALDGFIGTAVGMVYPDLKSLFEASARRVTVKLTWKEGNREHDIEIMQWVTIPQLGVQPAGSEEDEQDTDTAGQPGGSKSSSSGSGGGARPPGGPLNGGPPGMGRPGGTK